MAAPVMKSEAAEARNTETPGIPPVWAALPVPAGITDASMLD